jgi:hypothetical protein
MDILEDDLGIQDIKSWRLFEHRNETWIEYPNTTGFSPGKAFFLIVSRPGIKIDSGPGLSNDSGQAYAIPVQPGWNLVGNPFNFPVSTSKIRFQKSRVAPVLRTYNGQWSSVGDVSEILPFEGYAVFNHLPSSDVLLVDANSPVSTEVAAKQTNKMQAVQWSIQILAQCQLAQDSDNMVVVIPDAAPGWDLFDQPEPPVIGDFVSLYFPHPEWNMLTDLYSIDARPEPTDGDVWHFEVRTNIHDVVYLTFNGLHEIPSEFEIWLGDDILQVTQNLRKSNRFFIAPLPKDQSKSFRLMIGKPDFIKQQIEGLQEIPQVFKLSQNFPNPFNSVTTIRYVLPQAEKVTLKVFNILGKEVVTLVKEETKEPGLHTAIWQGLDNAGLLVASGIYIFRIRTDTFTKAKKMILVK